VEVGGGPTQPDIGGPPMPRACELEEPVVMPAPVAAGNSVSRHVKIRPVAMRAYRRKNAGRNTRKAYAAARLARMEAHAMRMRAGEAGKHR
jgi:hypothetical protein